MYTIYLRGVTDPAWKYKSYVRFTKRLMWLAINTQHREVLVNTADDSQWHTVTFHRSEREHGWEDDLGYRNPKASKWNHSVVKGQGKVKP
jgi:hypothetical protein